MSEAPKNVRKLLIHTVREGNTRLKAVLNADRIKAEYKVEFFTEFTEVKSG